ncbi:MAG: RNA methyltransferase [Candidatus Pacebacteria bacterium]|nr:RNA methyltransferase [Candidatus Paceibacterota bacterium]
MLTKNQQKLIKSLHEKKNRTELGLFLVEGEKSVSELLKSDFEIEILLTTTEFFDKYGEQIRDKSKIYEIVNQFEIEKVSAFETNDSVLAVAKQKINIDTEEKGLILMLDEIKDPGNLGTIIRMVDWYGVSKIIASTNTVDFYNPKVIASSMGAFTRVNLFYTDLKEYLSKTKLPIYGAFLGGENVHDIDYPKDGILVMGNESKGISKEIEDIIKKKITIPSYGKTESLNVSIATAIILDNWKRKTA